MSRKGKCADIHVYSGVNEYDPFLVITVLSFIPRLRLFLQIKMVQGSGLVRMI